MSDELKRLGPDQKYCQTCANVLDARAELCPKCGVRQPMPTGMVGHPTQKNRLAAGLFAILLGWLGVHKFYLGRPGLGILYALFFWTCIPGLLGIIEGILYLTMTDQAFQAQYG
jgi:TM2 domain-containing membrane protein YozV